MKKALPFLIALFFTLPVFSQSTIKGTVTDSVEKKIPENSVVSLLTQKDSTLIKFTRADKKGNFSLSNLKEGKYILLITHPYMGDYFDKIDLATGVTDLGNIFVTPKSKLLAEVIIKTGSPIKVKGDTTVYTADSFAVRPGANVEELLRRLPGIQVDKDGKITAMGEKVTKVLVDGEEFFGSDPGIATKNLRADAVKEVQVFDKKSDQAEFTGIDDGIKDKTINLKMKQQKGYFGKVELAGGIKDKYNNSAMLNSFKNKRKFATYGIVSNTGQTNLNWEDAQNYSGGADNMTTDISGNGDIVMSMTYSDEDGYNSGGDGIPKNWNAGLHYSNKFGKDNKQSFNSSYKFSKVNTPMEGKTFSHTFLPDTSWQTNSNTNNFSSTIKNNYNLTLDLNLDSANSLKWTTKLNNNKSNIEGYNYSESLTNSADSINNSKRNSTNNTNKNGLNTNLLWRHKFKKLARTVSVNTSFALGQTNSDGLLYSLNKYYDAGLLNKSDTLDQQNLAKSNYSSFSSKIAYTEPLAKDFYMELSYSIAFNRNTNDRTTNKKALNGKYEDKIDSLSNAFEFNRIVNTPGLNFRMNKKKYTYSFGAAVGFSNFLQKDMTAATRYKYNYTNFFPTISYQYKFKPNQSLRLNYNGSTNAPTLEQLQPIRVNTDPLNIYIGNPDLKQAFQHSFNLGYNSYNVLKEKNIWSNLSYNFTQNSFTQASVIDSVGKRTYQTVNTNGVYNLNLYTDYGFKITKAKLRLSVGPTGGAYHYIQFVNGLKNITTNTNYGFRMSINKYVENKFNFYISPSLTFNNSKSSLNAAANSKYWQLSGWANAQVTIAKKFEINTDINTEIKQKDPRFTQKNNYTKWNATVTKRFFKDNALEAKFGVYDILNQNKGYNRNFSSYSLTESYYNTLKRFWLLTLTWNISKNGKPAGGGF